MKNLRVAILVVLIFGFLAGCTKKDAKPLGLIEKKLPGKWKIESVVLPGWGSGIEYKGETFYHDTILYNIGEIEIPEFSTRLLDLNSSIDSTYACELIVGGDTFEILIEQLFMSEGEYFVYFRQGEFDLSVADNENAAFVSSSRLLNFNSFLFIINDDQMVIQEASGERDYMITLSK